MEKKSLEHVLISNLLEEFEQNGMEARIFGTEESGDADVEILRVIVDDYGVDGAPVLAEFFFLDTDNAAEDTLYFNCVINLSTELSKEKLPDLFAAISKLNFYLSGGGFAVDSEETILVYRTMVQMPKDFGVDKLNAMMSSTAAHALQFLEPYASVMIQIAEGRGGLDSLLSMLP